MPGGQGKVSHIWVDPGCHNPMFCQAELSSAELWFVESAYQAYVIDACNPDVNSYTVIQRQHRTFDVIKSIGTECVRAQQGVHGSKYISWRRNGFTEQ